MKCVAIVCAGLAAASALGQVTIQSAQRGVGMHAYASAPPDYFNYGDNYSNSSNALGTWGDSWIIGQSVGSEIGSGSAIGGAGLGSTLASDLINAQLGTRAEAFSEGSGSAFSRGDAYLITRFVVSAATSVHMDGDGTNLNGAYACSLAQVGGGTVVSRTDPIFTEEFVLTPGLYELSITSSCDATSNGTASHNELCNATLRVFFTLVPCMADFNGDTTVDFFDYLDFVDAFSGGFAGADFNHDSVVDFFDYLDFVDAFSTGC